MIPVESRSQIASELSALGGTPTQIAEIGEIVYTVAALDVRRDAEYLLERGAVATDPLVKRACGIIMDGLLSA